MPLPPPNVGRSASQFTQYRRSQIAELTPWTPGFDMSRVSVSAPDKDAGSPKAGDMIARNPKNYDDMWLVAAIYFADNFEPVPPPVAAAECGVIFDFTEEQIAILKVTSMVTDGISVTLLTTVAQRDAATLTGRGLLDLRNGRLRLMPTGLAVLRAAERSTPGDA